MRRLRNHLRNLHQRLNSKQRARQRLRDLERWMREHGFKFIAKTLDRRERKLENQCKALHREIRATENRIEQLKEQRAGGREKFVTWLKGEVGVQEGSQRHLDYIRILGSGSSSWPWCSAFMGAGLIAAGGFERAELPSNPWYSGSWLSWSGGHRVSMSEVIAGDLLIIDWGDGGMTDHVEAYIGGGQSIGGNESHPSGGVVKQAPIPAGNIVGVVRPNW